MKCLTLLLSFFLVLQVYAQNGIIGDGFANGWSNPTQLISFNEGPGGSRICIRNPNGTGNQYFRFVRNWDNNFTEYAPSGCVDVEWTGSPNFEYLNMPACGTGAFFINCPNTTDYYIFKTKEQFGNSFAYFRVQGAIRSAISVSSPVTVTTNEPYEVDVELDGALATGQQVYLRYTSDNFSNSIVVAMTGSGTSYSATIPGFSLGTSVIYYVFTSGNNPSLIDHGNADFYTINLNANGGSNYSYTVQAPLSLSFLEFSAEAKSAQVQLSAILDYENTPISATFQKMSADNDKTSWSSVETFTSSEIKERLELTDFDVERGSFLYRLEVLDGDGITYYSPIRKVELDQTNEIKLYPNPVSYNLNISSSMHRGEPEIVIYDVLGLVIKKAFISRSPFSLDVSDLPSGLYAAHIQVDQRPISIQLIIKE